MDIIDPRVNAGKSETSPLKLWVTLIRKVQGHKQYTLFTNSRGGGKGYIWRPPRRSWRCEICDEESRDKEGLIDVMTYEVGSWDGGI